MRTFHFRPKTLAGMLNFYLGLGLVLMTFILSVAGYYFISHILQEALQQKAHALAEQVVTTTLDAVLLNEYHVIERLTSDLVVQTPDLQSLVITNAQGQVLSEAQKPSYQPNQELPGLVIAMPLVFLNTPAGHIELIFSKQSIIQPLQQLSLWVALALLTMLTVLFLAVQKLLSRHVILPIKQLCDELGSTQKVLYETLNLKEDLPQELSVLNQAIVQLQQALQQHIQSLKSAHQFSAQATQTLCQSQRLATVGQLAAGLAHNLNTPLANIIGYAQMALQQTTDDSLQKRLHTIERQAKSCSEQVKNLLQAAKPPSLSLQKVDLVSLIGKVLEMMLPVVKQHSGTHLTFEHTDQAWCNVDIAAFEQVLFNLINNAIEAGTQQVNITLLTRTESNVNLADAWLECLISDNGHGIPQTLQSRVFEPFVSSKHTPSHNNSGTGLGLFLAKTLLNQMHGQLALEHSDEHGTVFKLTLPLNTQVLDSDSTANDSTRSVSLALPGHAATPNPITVRP